MLEKENDKRRLPNKFNLFSVFKKEKYERTKYENFIANVTLMTFGSISIISVIFVTTVLLGYLNKDIKDAERKAYESAAAEIGVHEKEIILSQKLLKPGTYIAKTSKGTYTLQFDEELNIKRIVKGE
ncbi:hypothetical protein [Metabacillus fastidiosus]|uniref:Uncharacterized protein n=1 Tax=Metabacillus fastidiosus TaxID=1458 RepID=A0ABU6P439_9BACI|nr:hypothetical protein [Metabacillus fastidiosus]